MIKEAPPRVAPSTRKNLRQGTVFGADMAEVEQHTGSAKSLKKFVREELEAQGIEFDEAGKMKMPCEVFTHTETGDYTVTQWDGEGKFERDEEL